MIEPTTILARLGLILAAAATGVALALGGLGAGALAAIARISRRYVR